MKKKYLSLILALSLTTALFVGCSNKSSEGENANKNEVTSSESASDKKTTYPITIDAFDAEGKTYPQTFKEAPKKVITNNQSSTELLLTLGLKDSIVGTGDLDTPIPESIKADFDSLPQIAQKGDVAKEVVIGAGPDLVIGRAMSFKDDRYGSIPSLNEVGVNTYVQLASKMGTKVSLDTIIQDVKNVGTIFNVQDKANKLADSLQKTLDDTKSKVPTSDQRKKVMLVVNYTGEGLTVFGANSSLQSEMLNALNADNVIPKGGPISLENMISANPDHIVYVTATKNASVDATAVANMLAEPTIQNVNAIKNKSIVSVDYTELMGYGHRTFDCLEKLAKALYPDTFK